MADQVTILELLVDAGPALDTLEKLVPALERVTDAAQQTASAVDRVSAPLTSFAESGSRLSTGATAAAAGVDKLATATESQTAAMSRSNAEAARSEQNLIRQSTAADGTVGATLKLTQQLANLSAAQAEVNQRMQQFGSGSVGKVAGEAELAALSERAKQTEAAISLLGSGAGSVAKAMQRFPEAFSAASNSAGSLVTQLERLVAKYDPATAAARKMQDELTVLTRAQAANATEGLNVAALQDKIKLAYDSTAAAAQKLAEAQAKLAQTYGAAGGEAASKQAEQMAAGAQRLRDQLDPLAAAQRTYNATLAENNRYRAAGLITEEEHGRAQQAAVAALNLASTATTGHTETLKENAAGHHQVNEESTKLIGNYQSQRTTQQELQHIIRATTDAYAAGIPITQALRFESGRLAEVLGVNFAALLQPTNLLLAGFAGAILLVGLHAKSIEDNIRSFGVSLRTLTTGGTTGAELEGVVEKFKQMGIAAGDAKKTVDTFLRAVPEGINPAASNVSRLGLLAANIAGARQTDVAPQAEELAKALTGNVDELIKYATTLGALRGPEADFARELQDEGKILEAREVLIKALEQNFRGAYKDAVGEFTKAIREVKAAWGEALDEIAKSPVGQFIVFAFKDIAAGILNDLHDIEHIVNVVKGIKDFVTSGFGGDKSTEDVLRMHGQVGEVAGTGVGFGTRSQREGPPVLAGGSVQEQVAAWLASHGYTAQATAAILGNAQIESGFDPNIANASGHLGLFQLDRNRQQQFGGDLSVQRQLEVLDAELSKRDPSFKTAAGSVSELTSRFEGVYEVSGGQLLNKRIAAAEGFAAASGTPLTIPRAGQTANVNEILRRNAQDLGVVSTRGSVEEEAERARIDAVRTANEKKLEGDERAIFIANEIAKVRDKSIIGIQKESEALNYSTSQTNASASAFQRSNVAGLQADAIKQASIEVNARYNTTVGHEAEVQSRANELLRQGAAGALQAESQREAVDKVAVSRQQQLADAAVKGAAAQHEASIQTQAAAQTYDALAKAQATGNQQLIAEAQNRQAVVEAQLRQKAFQQEEIQGGAVLERGRDQIAVTQLEMSLVGATTEEVQKQVLLLQTKLFIQEKMPETWKGENEQARQLRDQILGQATAQADLNIKYAEAQRAQQRLNDLVRGVADTIESQLGTALDNAFSGKKAQDWGETMKQILRDLLKQIVEFAFIQPAIGSALSALGFAQAAQQFGSFGGLGGGAGAIAGASSGGASGVSPGSLLQGAGQLKSLFGGGSSPGLLPDWLTSSSGSGGSGGGLFSGVSDFLSGINPFATSGAPLGGVAGAPFSSTIAGPSIPTNLLNGVTPVSPGLFGTTATFGSFLSGAGAGFGAGTLLNSLVGGNPLTGTVGSGVGAATGALIGSIVPGIGTLIGGLVGGAAGGGLGGLFGNSKPSNKSSGDLIDLSTGNISGFQSSGVAQNDQTVQQITKSVSDFSRTVQQLTGGTIEGAINVQAGSRDGIKASFSGPFGNFESKAQDAATEINQIELKIAQNLTGVSDTVKAVLGQITDPSQIQNAVTFAATYDNLKKAADSAFSSISDDTFKIGPFATAFANLTKTFGDLTTQANQFGLALDPINAGLAEATKRLQTDFGTSLDTALNTANANDFVNTLKTVSATFATNTQEAQAIGLGSDQDTAAKIALLETTQAAAALAPLTADQLQTVVTQLGKTNPEIAGMAQAILNAGLAATGATTSLGNLASGIKSVEDLATSLRTGQLSGLPPAQAAAAAGGSFATQLATTLAAGKGATSDQLTQLSSLGTTAIQASQAAYGEGPQTAALRTSILGGLGQVTAITGPSTAAAAAAAAASSPATAIQAALGASPAVQAAQVAAVMAALHVAGVPGYAGGTSYTAPGAILVGEAGPEVISQAGGLSVTPISAHPGWSWRGSSGTGDGVIAERMSALIAEVAALRRQTQGGQVQQMNDMAQQTGYLGQINRKAGPGVVQPKRQSAGR